VFINRWKKTLSPPENIFRVTGIISSLGGAFSFVGLPEGQNIRDISCKTLLLKTANSPV
jgi:hypothetical protein